MKLLRNLSLALLALLVAAVLARNLLIRHGAKAAVKAAVGIDLEIDNVDVGLFESRFRIEGLRVKQPEGFPPGDLIVLPLVDVDYELGEMLAGKAHCTSVELDVQEVNIVRNPAGEVNVNKLKAVEEAPGEKPPPSDGKSVEMQIDRLTLTIGKVRYTEIPRSGDPKVKEVDVGIDHAVFEDLHGTGQIARLVIFRAIKASGFRIAGVALDAMKSELATLKGKGAEALESISKEAEKAKGFLDKIFKR